MRAPVAQRTLYPLQGLDAACRIDCIQLQIDGIRTIAFYIKMVLFDCRILKKGEDWLGYWTIGRVGASGQGA